MSRVFARTWSSTGSADSRVQFGTEGGGSWAVWDRYILLDGKRAYHIGNICNTCSFFFERMDGANDRVEIASTAEALRNGLSSVSDPVVNQIGIGLPADEYLIMLLEMKPELARLG